MCDGCAMGGTDPNFQFAMYCVIFTPGGSLRKRVLNRFDRERHEAGDHKGRPYTRIDGTGERKRQSAEATQIHAVVPFNILRDHTPEGERNPEECQ